MGKTGNYGLDELIIDNGQLTMPARLQDKDN